MVPDSTYTESTAVVYASDILSRTDNNSTDIIIYGIYNGYIIVSEYPGDHLYESSNTSYKKLPLLEPRNSFGLIIFVPWIIWKEKEKAEYSFLTNRRLKACDIRIRSPTNIGGLF